MRFALVIAVATCCPLAGFALANQNPGIAWSPDGRQLAYLSADVSPELSLAKLETGAAEVLLKREDLARLLGAYRSEDNTARLQLFWSKFTNGLVLVCPQRIISFDIAARDPRLRFSSSDPIASVEISPDGRHLSFLRQGRIQLLDLKSGSVHPLTSTQTGASAQGSVHPEIQSAFEMPTAYWWAPDSSAIAYLQTETPQLQRLRSGAPLPSTRLWVCGLRDRELHLVDLGNTTESYVLRASWLPDSKRLVVQLLNREQTSLSVLLAYASPRPPTLLFKETDPYWINAGSVFHLFRDGARLLWSSERSGYRHLELYDLQNHAHPAITRGAWEVTDVSYVDEAEHQVYFTGTLSSPAERQLYRISLDGQAPPSRLTRPSGTHHVSFAPNGTAYVDTWSNVENPPVRSVHRPDGSLVLSLDPPKASEKFRCPPQFLTVRAHEGARLDAMLIRPPGLDAGRKYPVIIELNGEPRHQLVRDVWDGPRHAWHQAMAERGYIVLAFDSHGSGGHGHRFEEPIHYRLGAQEMSDLRDAVDWLRRLPYVDPGRLGVWGSTYNGFLALEAIFTDPGQIKAAVADSPILEWRGQSAPFVERYLGLLPLHHEEYEKSSPLEFSERFAGKLLVVTPKGSARVTADLEGLQSRLAKTRGSAQFLQAGTSNEFFEQMTEFFLRNL